VLSVLSGNTVNAPVSLPVNVCGVAVTLLGGANAGCAGGASSATVINNGNGGGNGNSGVASIGSGNTVNAPVSAPVNLCGVSAAVGGFANSGCKGGSASTTIIGNGGNNGGNGNSGQFSILSGNTVNTPVSVPVNLCSISLGLLGFANSGCLGGSHSVVIIPSCEHNCHTPPPCEHNCQTPPPCEHNCQTPPPCQHNCQTPPPCQHNCQTTPPGTQVMPTPPGNVPPGSGSTTTTPGTLPITGANILGMLAAAVASVGIGATLVIARRRRHGA
jgi:hypothetical protein